MLKIPENKTRKKIQNCTVYFLCIISYAMFYAVYSGCNYRRQIFLLLGA